MEKTKGMLEALIAIDVFDFLSLKIFCLKLLGYFCSLVDHTAVLNPNRVKHLIVCTKSYRVTITAYENQSLHLKLA